VTSRTRPPALPLRALLAAALVAGALGGSQTATGAPSPRRDRADGPPVAILMYHHVGAVAPSGGRHPRLWVSRALFVRQLEALERAGYRAVTLNRVWRAWHEGGELPAKSVVLSFDDGYRSQYRNAAPALRRHDWPGVLNLEVHRLGVRQGISRAEVRRLVAAGWEVDAHTLTHPDLTRVDAARLHDEIAGSRAAIQRALGVPVEFFCYPYGRFDATVKAAVRAAGFLAATTTRTGLAWPHTDPYALGRIRVDGHTAPKALLELLHNGRSRG
jgi:peptidoglycan/xylan/chitin deacetylase (PgdA/CDA1 family)